MEKHYIFSPDDVAIRLVVDPPDIKPEIRQRMAEDGFKLQSSFGIDIVRPGDPRLTISERWRAAEVFRRLPPPEIEYDDLYQITQPRRANQKGTPLSALAARVEPNEIIEDIFVVRRRTGIVIPSFIPNLIVAVRDGPLHHPKPIPIDTLQDWNTIKAREPYAIDWQELPDESF